MSFMEKVSHTILSLVVASLAVFAINSPVLDDAQQAVVLISNDSGGNGSGVIIAPNVVVTAAHVAAASRPEDQLYARYKGYSLPIQVIKIDHENDMAILRIEGVKCPCVPVASKAPSKNEKVWAVGYPVNSTVKNQITTEGISQGVNSDKKLVFTAPIAPGNSGGAVFRRGWFNYELVTISVAAANASLGFMGSTPVWHLGVGPDTDLLNKFIKES